MANILCRSRLPYLRIEGKEKGNVVEFQSGLCPTHVKKKKITGADLLLEIRRNIHTINNATLTVGKSRIKFRHENTSIILHLKALLAVARPKKKNFVRYHCWWP